METLLDYRPLAIAIIEIILVIVVLRKGNLLKLTIASLILLLAGYQLGEFFIIKDIFGRFGYQLAFVSTTLLPPIGILILDKISKRKLYYEIFFTIALLLAFSFIIDKNLVELTGKCNCFAKFNPKDDSKVYFFTIWAVYYQAALILGIIGSFLLYYKEKVKKIRNIFFNIFLIYLSFFPFTYVLVVLFDIDLSYVTSIMCTLALVGAFIATRVSIKYTSKVLK